MSARVLSVGDEAESGGKGREKASGQKETGEEMECVQNGVVAVEGGEDEGEESESELEGEEEVLYETSTGSSQEKLESSSGSVGSEEGTCEERYKSTVQQLEQAKAERDVLTRKLATTISIQEQSYQEIAKELEAKCFSQQEQLDTLQEQLEIEREQAEGKQAALKKELTLKVDQVTATHKSVQKEKEGLADKLAVMETETKSLREQLASAQETAATAAKENEKLQSLIKKQKTEMAKVQATCEQQESRVSEQAKELARLKEEVSSLNIKIRWAQNKLKTETDTHKETKSQLASTAKKLKEAREEGEQIRSDLKSMITQYQESEEMRSNSLDVKLKKTEKELKAHEQEIADQQELHTLTVKELELVKAAHIIAVTECQQLKTKLSEQSTHLAEAKSEADELRSEVKCLREEKCKLTSDLTNMEHVNHTMEGEKQKLSSLRESYGQLQRSYQHLEKDLGRRKERETELLSLTERLSSANAELQAERSSWDTKARPRVMHYYTSPNILRSLDSSIDSTNSPHLNNIAHQLNSPSNHLSSPHPVSRKSHLDSLNTVHVAAPHTLNTTTLTHLFHSGGATWKARSFCNDFLERRYHTPVKVCTSKSQSSAQIRCFWNPANAHAATCDIENMMVHPKKLWKAMTNVHGTFPHSNSVWLLDSSHSHCHKPTIHNLEKTMEGGDYVKWFVDDLISNPSKQSTSCHHWINETVFLFSSHSHHVYFRLLAYYSVHKSLLDHHVEPGQYRIFRLSEGFNYIFPEYEGALFPGVQPITELPDFPVCFKKAVLVPKCYATVLFQCKMQLDILDKCGDCNGRGLPGTSLMSFRSRVLAACGLRDGKKSKSESKLITVILRKPYNRWEGDHPGEFERVLTNSQQLITGLQKAFPDSVLKPLHMEDLTVCEQVSYTHDADVLIGVHGAGLVHLWWLREDALMIELEPYFEMGNPSFKTLAKLTGRRYVSIPIKGMVGGVSVDVSDVINSVKSHTKLT